MSQSILGVDVAKLKLDVALRHDDTTVTQQFPNTAAGHQALQAWLVARGVTQLHACLEATGSYSEAVAHFLYAAGHLVSLVNPLRTKGYAKSRMQRNKTDKADACLLADFCATQNLTLWRPLSPAVAHLQALTRRIETLGEMLQMEKNRLELAPLPARPSLERMIQTFEQEIAALWAAIREHMQQHPELREQSELLQTIPGIGAKTATLLLAEIEFAQYDSARAVAAYAGVTPRQQQSGTSLHASNLCKMGNGRLRKGLYFPAVVAKQHNPLIKEWALRLQQKGKTPLQIVCAAMRKLLHIAFGVLKHKCPFQAAWGLAS